MGIVGFRCLNVPGTLLRTRNPKGQEPQGPGTEGPRIPRARGYPEGQEPQGSGTLRARNPKDPRSRNPKAKATPKENFVNRTKLTELKSGAYD